MLVKDQLKIRMDQLKMPVNELAKRVDVSGQSVRHWLAGRSFPGKAKCNAIEEALSFKLDFSEGESTHSITVEQTIKQSSVDTLLAISRLEPEVQLLFAKLAMAFLESRGQPLPIQAPLQRSAESPVAQPVQATAAQRAGPPGPANHGRAVGRIARKIVSR